MIAKGLRAFGDGYVSLLLPIYLLQLGFNTLEVGIIATTTLLGSGVLTLFVGLHAYRFHYRSLLLATSALMIATGLGFAVLSDFWPLMLIAFVGTLNPSSGDVSVFLPLEHAFMSRLADAKQRTAIFARYSVIGSLLAALGSLAAATPSLMVAHAGMSNLTAMRAMFVLYAVIALAAGVVYRSLPLTTSAAPQQSAAPLQKSKKIVYVLAALFSLDALGGGFVVQSMLALWLYQRHGMDTATAGSIFFCMGVLTAGSYLVAVRIANRIGLVNTMVFTHLPANVCLVLIPFMSDLSWVIALLFIRAALSQMDVPTRSAYVMAIVSPAERPAAASITSVPRSLASAISPFMAGYLLTMSSFGWPLIAAGALKIVYDILLLIVFGKVRPPEE